MMFILICKPESGGDFGGDRLLNGQMTAHLHPRSGRPSAAGMTKNPQSLAKAERFWDEIGHPRFTAFFFLIG